MSNPQKINTTQISKHKRTTNKQNNTNQNKQKQATNTKITNKTIKPNQTRRKPNITKAIRNIIHNHQTKQSRNANKHNM